MEPLIVGIAVGASTAAIGYYREMAGRAGEVEVAQTHSFRRTVQAALCFDRGSGKWYAGNAAWLKGREPENAGHFLRSPMPYLSTGTSLAVGTVAAVEEDGKKQPLTSGWLLGQVLRSLIDGLIKQAEDDFRVEEVVLTAPLSRLGDWTAPLRAACAVAGVALAEVVSEPECLLASYLFDTSEEAPAPGEQVLLFNWGGEALQLATVRALRGTAEEWGFELEATASAPIGGHAVDARIRRFLRRTAGDDVARPLPAGARSHAFWQRLEEAKISLSNALEDEAEGGSGGASYPEVIDVPLPGGSRRVDVSGAELMSLLEQADDEGRPAIARTVMELCERVREAGGPIQRVFLAGGSAHLPVSRRSIARVFGDGVTFQRLPSHCHPEEAVVRGAVLRAARRRGKAIARSPRLQTPALLQADVHVQLLVGDEEQTAMAFAAGTLLQPGVPLARATHWQAGTSGSATLRCLSRQRDEPYERLPGRERRVVALNLGLLERGAEVEAEVRLIGADVVALVATGPGWRLGPVDGQLSR